MRFSISDGFDQRIEPQKNNSLPHHLLTESETMESDSSMETPINNVIPESTHGNKNNHVNLTIKTAEVELQSPSVVLPASSKGSSADSSSSWSSLSSRSSSSSALFWDSSRKEKRMLDECWDRILLKSFDDSKNQSNTSCRNILHKNIICAQRKHQLVILSGEPKTGKTLLSHSLNDENCDNEEEEYFSKSKSNRIFLRGTAAPPLFVDDTSSISSADTTSAVRSRPQRMEPLYVFTCMMQQLSNLHGVRDGEKSTGESAEALPASSSVKSHDTIRHNPKNSSGSLFHQLFAALTDQFSDKEQTILVRTFPHLQAFFPQASPKAKFLPTHDLWTRRSPKMAGSYEHAFHKVMQRFFGLISQILPLILVVDDLQDLDVASLELLDYLLSSKPFSPATGSILFVFCYTLSKNQLQSDDQDKDYYRFVGHDKKRCLNEMFPLNNRQNNHLLSTLNYCHVQGIKRLPHYDFELTEIVMSPLDLTTKTQTQRDKPSIDLDGPMNEMKEKSLPLQLLQSLAPVDMQVAKLAACLGIDPIPLNLLEIVYDAHNASYCQTPIHSKVAPNAHALSGHLARLISQGIFCWNSHKTQMAWANPHLLIEALNHLEEGESERQFRIVADGLAKSLSEEQKEHSIYLIVDLHNAAGVVAEKEIKTGNLGKLNLQAALRAIQSGSLVAADHYLSQGIRALKQAASVKKHHHHALERSLYRLWMQVSAYIGSDVGLRVASSQLMVEEKQGLLEKLIIHQTQFSGLLSSCSINPNSTHIAQQGANRCFQLLACDLAMKFPTKELVQGVTVTKGLMKLKSQSKSKAILAGPNSPVLLKIPIMDKPMQLVAMKLLDTCANFCYMAGDVRFPLVVIKSVELFQKYGLSIYAPPIHALVGILMVVALDDVNAGVAYANYSLALLTRTFETNAVQKTLESQTISLSHFVVLPWAKTFSSVLQPLQRAYELAMQGGDIDTAAQSIANYTVLAFLSGMELSDLNKELCYYVNELRRFNRVKWEIICQIWWYVVRKLLPVDRSLPLAPGPMSEEEIMTYVLQTKDEDALCNFNAAKAILYTLQGNHQKAANNALENSEHIFKTLKGHPVLMVLPFYMGISLCEVAQESVDGNYLRQAKKMLSLTKEYNKKGNPNTIHHLMTLEAEIQVLSDNFQRLKTARNRYQAAITCAVKAELFQDAALLHQRFGHFLRDRMDNMESSKEHILLASTNVRLWGAQDNIRL